MPQAYDNRGLAYCNQGKFDEGIADFSEAIRLDPKLTSAYSGRADAYDIRRNYDKAIADSTEVIRRDPKSAKAYTRPGQVYSNIRASTKRRSQMLGRPSARPQIRQGVQRPGHCL